MEFYNPDGTGGMMCGNGGRCIAAFADYLGLKPSKERTYVFDAADGVHCAQILSRDSESKWTVRLRMIDVHGVKEILGGHFLNTGTRHFVKIVGDVEKVNVDKDGRELRLHKEFAPEGRMQTLFLLATCCMYALSKRRRARNHGLRHRPTASAIAAYKNGIAPQNLFERCRGIYPQAHTTCSGEFYSRKTKDIFLTG